MTTASSLCRVPGRYLPLGPSARESAYYTTRITNAPFAPGPPQASLIDHSTIPTLLPILLGAAFLAAAASLLHLTP